MLVDRSPDPEGPTRDRQRPEECRGDLELRGEGLVVPEQRRAVGEARHELLEAVSGRQGARTGRRTGERALRRVDDLVTVAIVADATETARIEHERDGLVLDV